MRRQLDHRFEIEFFGDPGAAPVATVREGPVEREDDALGTCGLGALETLHHDIAATAPVHLEQQLRVHRSNVFHRLAAERTETHGDATVGGGATDGNFTVGMHSLHACGRDDDGHRDVETEHRGVHRTFGLKTSNMRGESELVERGQVAVERQALFSTTDDGAIDRLRQTLLGPALCHGNGFKPLIGHLSPPRTKVNSTGSPR